MAESAPTFRILGPLEVAGRDGEIAVGGRRRRAMLAFLLVNAGSRISLDALHDAVWDGSPSDSAGATTRTYVSQFRKLPHLRIESESAAYRVEVDPGELDADVLRTLTAEARRDADPAQRLAHLDRAVALWRGDPLDEFVDAPWAAVESEHLRAIFDDTRKERFEALLALGRHAECRADLDRAVATAPLDERLRILQARALYGTGDGAAALRTLAELRRLLGEELGMSPGPELIEVERQLLARSSELDNQPSPAIVTPDAGSLPDGTVTFLFIDMVGSTALVTELGDVHYAEVLGEYRRRLTEAIERRGGVVFGFEGDAVFAAFPSASGAADAARDGQRRLTADIGDVTVRARMGLHAGEALVVGADYVGTTVHVAARVAAAAHGGQIVASESCRVLAADMPWTDLGMHRLKDVDSPQHLHQLAGEDAEFPPLRTAENVPTNLPAPLDTFVGRGGDIDALVERVPAARLTTLVGPGGVGKTRLAIESARTLRTSHPGGVHFIELANVTAGGDLAAAVTRTLVDAGARGSDLRSVLGDVVAGQPTLLVLDNCEHLLAAAAGLAQDLLAWESSVRLLATSREPLRVRGERVHHVESLSTSPTASSGRSPAERLFVDRAEAATGRPVGDRDLPVIRQICADLDGLPLAIELAAARTTSLAPIDVAQRLENRFSLLRSDGPTDEARHRTLKAVVDWSYELLTPIDRALFNRLSVFGAPFTLDAAEAVAASDAVPHDYVIDGVAHLVDKSLVQLTSIADAPAYRLLDTLRSYGRTRLSDGGQLVDAEDALLAWAMEVTARLERDMRTARQDATLRSVLPHNANLRHAMELLRGRDRPVDALRVVASVPVDIAPERVRIIEELLPLVNAGDHADVVGRAHFAAANCELERSNFSATLAHARAAGNIFDRIGDERLVGWASFMGSFGAWGTGDLDAAQRSARDAHDLFERNDDRSGLANASWLAIMLEPDLAQALERGRQAEAELRRDESPFALMHCLEAIALAELLADLPADAAPRLSEALRLATDLRVSGCAAHTIEAIAACVAAVAEPPARAAIAELLGAAEELRVATGHRHRPWELGGQRAALSILGTSMTDEELAAAIARGRGHRLGSAAELGQRTLSRFFPDVEEADGADTQ